MTTKVMIYVPPGVHYSVEVARAGSTPHQMIQPGTLWEGYVWAGQPLLITEIPKKDDEQD